MEMLKMKTHLRPWWPVTSRLLAAVFGGYVFSYAFTAALARLLPLAAVDSLIVATLPAYLVYTAAILWAFAARNLWHAWGGVVTALPLALIGFWPRLLEHIG